MVWSNWQGAIWRGAMVVILFWSGLASTQTPAPRPACDVPEPIMVVHENGKSTRCRVLESWQLPDGRIAHLLQAIETEEMITIVDEQASTGESGPRNPRAMMKRIFSWGLDRRLPPEGSPIPPRMRHDSGIVLKNEPLPSQGAVPTAGHNPQVIDSPNAPVAGQPITPPANSVAQAPKIINEQPKGPDAGVTKPNDFQGPVLVHRPPLFPRIQSFLAKSTTQPNQTPNPAGPTPSAPGVNPPIAQPGGAPTAPVAGGQPVTQPIASSPPTAGVQPTPQNAVPTADPKIPALPNLVSAPKTGNPQIIDSPNAPVAGQPITPPAKSVAQAPRIINEQPKGPDAGVTKPNDFQGSGIANRPSLFPRIQSFLTKPTTKPNQTPNPAGPTPSAPTAPVTGGQPVTQLLITNSPPTVGVQPPPPPINPGAVQPGVQPVISDTLPPIGPLDPSVTDGQPPAPPINPGIVKPNGQPYPPPPVPGGQPVTQPLISNTPPMAGVQPTPQPLNPDGVRLNLLPNPPTMGVQPTLQPIYPTGIPPLPAAPLIGDLNKPVSSKPVEPAVKKPWRPGNILFGWMHKEPTPGPAKVEPVKTEPAKTQMVKAEPAKTPTPKVEPVKTEEPKNSFKTEDFLAQQNKIAERKIAERVEKMGKVPFSTALAPNPPEAKRPEPAPLAIPKPQGIQEEKPVILPPPTIPTEAKPATVAQNTPKRDMWGLSPDDKVVPPGKSLLAPTAMKPEVVKLPPPPVARQNDPLVAPERFIPKGDRLKPKATMLAPVAAAPNVSEIRTLPSPVAPSPSETRMPPAEVARPIGWPLGAQSVLAAQSGIQGPVTYVPVPTVTVPQPNNPPMPPPPNMPDAPQRNAYVNAFTPPQPPKAAPSPQQAAIPQWMQPNPNAMMQQQMLQQQQAMIQQQMLQQQQAMMQQQMMQQQAMMAQGYRPNSGMMNPNMPYGNPMPAQAPTMNYARQYTPSPYVANPAMSSGYAPANYPPPMPMHSVMPQQTMGQPASYPMQTQPAVATQQVEQLIKVMRESPYPAQREWAAQALTSFEWRTHPQVVPALLQSASQDPAAGVRAGCVNCLGRMQAAVEPVFGTLHGMRNDIDSRVRQEVERAFVRLGQTPMAPH